MVNFWFILRMANVSSALNAHGISQIVQSVNGNPKKFRDCVKNIKKYCKFNSLLGGKKKLEACQSRKGAVSEFIYMYMEAFPLSTWPELKKEPTNKFSVVTACRYALSLYFQLGKNLQKH